MSPLVFALQLPRLFFSLTYLNAYARKDRELPSFNKDQASAISYTIRTLRPAWNYGTLMSILEGFAAQNRPVADVVTACFRAAQDPKAQAPTAIGWEQYWVKSGKSGDDGTRMCGECLTRKPLGHMASPRPPFICQNCAKP